MVTDLVALALADDVLDFYDPTTDKRVWMRGTCSTAYCSKPARYQRVDAAGKLRRFCVAAAQAWATKHYAEKRPSAHDEAAAVIQEALNMAERAGSAMAVNAACVLPPTAEGVLDALDCLGIRVAWAP